MHYFRRAGVILSLTALVFGLVGIALLFGGVWLAMLGGSIYYVFAGFGILATAALLIARRSSALWVYAAVLVGTMIWAAVEVGFDWWPLAARGDIIFPLGIWLITPWITHRLHGGAGLVNRGAPIALLAALALAVLVFIVGLSSNYHDIDGTIVASGGVAKDDAVSEPDEDWRAYGRTQFGQRYSPLTQITPSNVSKMKIAWTFRTGDLPGPNDPVETTFEVTPIKVHNTLYLWTSTSA